MASARKKAGGMDISERRSDDIHRVSSSPHLFDSAAASLLSQDSDIPRHSVTRKPLKREKSVFSEEAFNSTSPSAKTEGAESAESANDTTWRTSYCRRGPILGLVSLLLVFLGIPATAIVLKVSDGQPVQKWNTLKPNVYLAVITGIGNKLLAFAALQGAIITWWLRALDGTTLRSLHRDWAIGPGSNLWTILTAGITAGSLTTSAVCAAFIFIDGILLQSATTVQQANFSEAVALNVSLFPEIPKDYTGSIHRHSFTEYWLQGFYTPLLPVYQDMIHSRRIPSPAKGCPGVCTAILRSAALWPLECAPSPDETGYMNVSGWIWYDVPWPDVCVASDVGYQRCPLFKIYIGIPVTELSEERIAAWIGLSDEGVAENQSGNFTTKQCSFRPAVVDYPVTFRHGFVEVQFDKPTLIDWAHNNDRLNFSADTHANTSFSGIAVLADLIWSTSFTVGWGDNRDPQFDNVPITAAKYLANPEEYFDFHSKYFPRWKDPHHQIRMTLNEIMFRTSVQAARDANARELADQIDKTWNITSVVQAQSFTSTPTFHTRWNYYIAASLIQLLCVVLVAWTFWDYWRLGRAMSLSPLEIAKAFDAPLLRSADSNMTGKEIASKIGEMKVRYGAVDCEEGAEESASRRLIFEEPDRVYKPMNTFSFGP